MQTVVTGASGFAGGALVRELLEAGHEVRAADVKQGGSLAGLDVETTTIDVLDPPSLRRAFRGADAVFHLAAVISITGDPRGIVQRVNVEGPRHVAEAAMDCGVERLVHCSSAHAFDLERCGPSLDEEGPRALGAHAPAYDRSKNAGEKEVQTAIAQGLDAVIVNPTGMIGPYDSGPSRMGELLLQLQSRRIPVNVGGGFDFVDVRDVASGLLAAYDLGRCGENYLLSGHRHTIKEIGQLAEEVTGVPAPRIDVPLFLIERLAPIVTALTPRTQTPLFTPDALHAVCYSPSVSHYKASTQLGYLPRPIRETIADAYAWFDEHPPE